MAGDMKKVIKGKPASKYRVKKAKYGWHGGKKLNKSHSVGA